MQIFLYIAFAFLCVAQIDGRSTKKAGAPMKKDDWQGPWFPHAPGVTQEVDDWTGPWFPHAPGVTKQQNSIITTTKEFIEDICDDGVHRIGVDFAPSNNRDSYHNLCVTATRSAYQPNLRTVAVLTQRDVPPAYMPPIKCLNESITYEERLPTFGSFRPMSAKYGEYKYLPPQRWLRSLAEGAIVMLYHPCAFPGQVEQLKITVKSCLYRHIISPTHLLSPGRPLALLAWGKSLEMSVVDKHIVVDFIKENAKKGPLKMNLNKPHKSYYDVGLKSEAHLITGLDDTQICDFQEM